MFCDEAVSCSGRMDPVYVLSALRVQAVEIQIFCSGIADQGSKCAKLFIDAGVADAVSLHPAFGSHGFIHRKRRHKNRPDSVECHGIGHVDQILKSFLWSGILKDEIVGSRQDHNDVWMMRNNVSLKAG